MKIWLCILSLFCWANLACAQAPQDYPDVPLDDSAYKELYVLHETGVVERWSIGSSRYMVRYEFAVAIARILDSIATHATERNAITPIATERIDLLRKSPAAIAALARLAEKFTPELQQLGISQTRIELAQKELASYRGSTPAPVAPFPDVPKTHWAFAAVERLQQNGIVVGYPAGTAGRTFVR